MKELGQAIVFFTVVAVVVIMFVLTFRQICSQLKPGDYRDNKIPITCTTWPLRPERTP